MKRVLERLVSASLFSRQQPRSSSAKWQYCMFACCRRGYEHPESIVPPLIFCPRLVKRVPAGMGSFPQAGHPQHADALSGVVAVWDCGVPGRHHQRGWVGGSVRGLSAGCDCVHGNSLTLSLLRRSWVGLMKSQNTMYASVTFDYHPSGLHPQGDNWESRFVSFTSPCSTVSNGLLRGCQRAGRKCSRCWEHGSSQAVQQGLPHLCMYESDMWPRETSTTAEEMAAVSNYVFRAFANLQNMLIYMMHLHLPLLSKKSSLFLTHSHCLMCLRSLSRCF